MNSEFLDGVKLKAEELEFEKCIEDNMNSFVNKMYSFILNLSSEDSHN